MHRPFGWFFPHALEADRAVQETEEKVKTIEKTLEELRNAFDAIERLGL